MLHRSEVKLRGLMRSQVQLGNEGDEGEARCALKFAPFGSCVYFSEGDSAFTDSSVVKIHGTTPCRTPTGAACQRRGKPVKLRS